jgi:hypothetical protein
MVETGECSDSAQDTEDTKAYLESELGRVGGSWHGWAARSDVKTLDEEETPSYNQYKEQSTVHNSKEQRC